MLLVAKNKVLEIKVFSFILDCKLSLRVSKGVDRMWTSKMTCAEGSVDPSNLLVIFYKLTL